MTDGLHPRDETIETVGMSGRLPGMTVDNSICLSQHNSLCSASTPGFLQNKTELCCRRGLPHEWVRHHHFLLSVPSHKISQGDSVTITMTETGETTASLSSTVNAEAIHLPGWIPDQTAWLQERAIERGLLRTKTPQDRMWMCLSHDPAKVKKITWVVRQQDPERRLTGGGEASAFPRRGNLPVVVKCLGAHRQVLPTLILEG